MTATGPTANDIPPRSWRPGDIARNLLSSPQQNAVLKSRIGSVLHLLSGNLGVALIMLASTAVAARTMGPADFGAFALVLAVGRVSERLLRFESWQPLIRYVAVEENAADPERLSRLYAYGMLLDVCSALLAAVLCVIAGWFGAGLIGLKPDQTGLIAIYAIAIAFNYRGVSSAALRMSGKFRTLAYIQLIAGLLRLALASAIFLLKGGLIEFVMVWTGAQILDSLVFNTIGLRTLAKGGIPSPLRTSWRGLPAQFPGFLGFAFSTNLSSALRTLTHEADTLLVGYFAGPAGAGLYYLVRRIAKVAQQVGDMIQAVAYPDLARMWAGKGHTTFGQTIRWLQTLLAAVGVAAIVVCWFVGEVALKLVFGPGFVVAFPMLLAQLIAVSLILHAAPSRSALLAMNRPTYVLAVAGTSTAIFSVVAFVTMPRLGVIGANFAHIAFGLTTAVALDIAVWRGLSQARADAARRLGSESAT